MGQEISAFTGLVVISANLSGGSVGEPKPALAVTAICEGNPRPSPGDRC